MNDIKDTRPPPDKKRRTEPTQNLGAGDTLWDDDECDNFTEDQWENIDVLVASQQASSSSTQRPGVPLQASTNTLVGRGTAKSKSSSDVTYDKGVRLVPSGRGNNVGGRQGLVSGPEQRTGVGRQGAGQLTGVSSLPDSKQQENNVDPQPEIQRLLKQVEEFKNAQYSTNGRIKILQQNVAQKDAELLRIKQEKAAVIDQKARETTENEKHLDREVNRLQTQLQFKERELMELMQQCKSRDAQPTKCSERDSRTGAQGTSTPVGTPQVSPKNKTAVSPRPLSDFPTRQSFLKESPSSKQSLIKKFTSEKAAKPVDCSEKSGRQRLKIKNPRGQVNGQQLVSKLTHAHSGASDMIPAPVKPSPFNSSLLENSGASTETQSSLSMSTLATSSESSQEEGWSENAQQPTDEAPNNTTILLRTVYSMLHTTTMLQPLRKLLEAQDSDSGLLLPVISSSLAQCLDSWEAEEELPSSDPTSSPSAHGSGTESWTPSEASPDRGTAGRDTGTAVDTDVVPLLRLLLCLVENSQRACQMLLEDFNGSDVITVEVTPMPGTSKQKDFDNIPNMEFLCKLCSLVNPSGPILRHTTLQVRTLALDIVATVLESAKPTDLRMITQRLLDSFIGSLANTDSISESVTVATAMLRVLNSLVRAENILSILCSQSTMLQPQTQTYQCLLGRLYNLCEQSFFELPKSIMTVLQNKLIGVISTAISCQKLAVNHLLNPERECNCGEIVQRLVCMLHDTWQTVPCEHSQDDLDQLRQGLSVLQIMALVERDFPEHREDAEHFYVDLVCNMEQVYSDQLNDAHTVEKFSIHDLTDFRHDLPMDDDETEESQEATETLPPPKPAQPPASGSKEVGRSQAGARPSGSSHPTVADSKGSGTAQEANRRVTSTTREPGKLSRRKNSVSLQRQNSGKHGEPMDVSHR